MATQKARDRIVNATMSLLADQSWDRVTLETIADAADISLAQLRDAFDGRTAILAELARRIDRKVLDNLDPAMAGEPARERLFDILFSRFEALEGYRPGLRNLAGAVAGDPFLALELNRIVTASMNWMLAAAGVGQSGPGGMMRAQALAVVWGQVMRVWLDDDDPGRARTMAELDKRLRQAERNMLRLERLKRILPGRRRRKPENTADAAA